MTCLAISWPFPGVEIVRMARKDVKENIARDGGKGKSFMLRKLGFGILKSTFPTVGSKMWDYEMSAT